MRRLCRGSVGNRTDRLPYAVLDVETDGLRGEIVWWTATCECRADDVVTGSDASSLWDHVTRHSARSHANRDHVWWAHNGGEYDYLYLIDPIRQAMRSGQVRGSPVMRDTTMIGWRIADGHHRLDLRDSFAMLPLSLRSLTDDLAPHLPKGDIGLSDGVVFDPSNPDHREYAARDSVALLAVMTTFRSMLADEFGGTLPSWSIAGTSLRAWRQTLRLDESYRPLPETYVPFVRSGYHGGIVHLGRRCTTWHDDCLTVDVNSMYPSVMRESGVPSGTPRAIGVFDPHRPGMYRVRVVVPDDTEFTFVPHRDRSGLSWPTGSFASVLTSIEIVAAREHGIGVIVEEGIVWPCIVHPFGEYVDRIERMRSRGGASSTVGKIMGNALYGKFGSRPSHDEWMVSLESPGDGWGPAPHDAFGPRASSYEGVWMRSDVPIRAPYLLPHWAAWITAGARLRLLALADAVGPEHVLYGDTDSVTAERSSVEAAITTGRLTIGSSFGSLKIERNWRRFRSHGPKVVEGIDAQTGEPVFRGKGIPRRLVSAAFEPGRPHVEWDSPTGALNVLRGSPMIIRRRRRLSTLDHSFAWRMVGDDVRPIRVDE